MTLDLGPLGSQGKCLIQDPSEEECWRLQEQSLCKGCRLWDGSCEMCFAGGRRDLQGVILDGTLWGVRICVGSSLAKRQTCGIPLQPTCFRRLRKIQEEEQKTRCQTRGVT